MSRRTEKLFASLDALEAEFRSALVKALRLCAAGWETELFLVSSMRPDHWPPNLICETADELFAEASAILALRAQLGVDAEPCFAADYRDACVRYVNFDDHHRPGPRQQAQLLLQQLGEGA